VLASTDNFTIVIRGRGGHAAYPHLAGDPVPVACEVAMALQTMVTRTSNVFSPGVLTIGRIEAGTASNIIPETATLAGTIRTLSPETRGTLVGGLARVARGVAAAHGLEAEVQHKAGYPVTVNDERFTEFVMDTGRELLGAEHCLQQLTPQLAGEDFSYVLEKIPGVMMSLGTRPADASETNAPHAHSNHYRLNEDALPIGVAMYAAVALKYLGGG
jgi:hippurate hydrolase